MRGLIEMAIEREAERLDEILESGDLVDPPFFAPRHFRARVHPPIRKFAPRERSRRSFAPRILSSPRYVI